VNEIPTSPIQPLPRILVDGYRRWRETVYVGRAEEAQRLSDEGQRPHTMLISCCDSRMLLSHIFGIVEGEMFVHRNIANLVPPYSPDGTETATAAAVEFAVTALRVSHLVVMGHTRCGGVRGFHDLCVSGADRTGAGDSFVARWMETLRPALDRHRAEPDMPTRLRKMEAEGVRLSLENLMTYPFVIDAVKRGHLQLHGAMKNIAAGTLHSYDAATRDFVPV
jgi:carbonic anhydrase